jgi:hypothetical protein
MTNPGSEADLTPLDILACQNQAIEHTPVSASRPGRA